MSNTVQGARPTIPPGASRRAVTPIGIDLGVRHLVVAAAADQGAHVDDAVAIDGALVRALYHELGAITRRLQMMDEDTREREKAAFRKYYDWITSEFSAAIAQVWQFADQFNQPVLVLEQLGHRNLPLVECRRGELEAGNWIMPAFQKRLASHSRREGYAIGYVDRDGTTKECHVCNDYGNEHGDQLRCVNDDCPVDEVCRDRSAAVSIASRYSTHQAPDLRC